MSKTSAAKAKGRTFENDIADFLSKKGIGCERRTKSGSKDKGDILVYSDPTFVIEAKAERKITLAEYVEELSTEIDNAGGDRGVVVVKRVRKNVSQAYVVIPLEMFIDKFYERKPDNV